MKAERVRWSMLATDAVIPDEVRSDLEAAFNLVFVGGAAKPSAQEIASAANGCEVLFTTIGVPLDREVFALLPDSVRAVATYSVAVSHIDLEAARRRGLAVFHTPDVLTASVAEAALLLMLGAARRATESIALVRSGAWPGWNARQLNGVELKGKSLGIYGMGRIGRRIAQIAQGLGLDIHYHSRARLPEELARGTTFHPEVDSMLRMIDVLVLAAPATPETRGFLNETRLSQLRPGAIIVNVARGDLVDDEALIGALTSKRVFAAGLDVFNGEPRIDPRYLDLPNVFILPHIGSSTVEARRRMGMILIEGINAWRRGEQPTNRLI
jgi:lactate dehydrogenase-like 2-hydroxyacid dehydrogenase